MMLRRLLLLASLGSFAMPLLAADAPDIFERVEHHEATSSDGVKIHYVSIGQGPVVLFVHGFPDFWYTWRHQMEALHDSYRTVAMDLRAYNLSGQPKELEAYARPRLLARPDGGHRRSGSRRRDPGRPRLGRWSLVALRHGAPRQGQQADRSAT